MVVRSGETVSDPNAGTLRNSLVPALPSMTVSAFAVRHDRVTEPPFSTLPLLAVNEMMSAGAAGSLVGDPPTTSSAALRSARRQCP